MPKIKCENCGRTYYGWALEHKVCYCDECGYWLNWDLYIPQI